MLVTRKKQVPTHWVFYAQIPFVMAIAANFAMGAPFLFALKKFIDNPAAITFLLSVEVFVTVLGGPFASWLSDRVWTRWGRRKIFIVIANIPQAAAAIAMPFAPNLFWLIALRWIYGIFGDIASPNQALTMEVVPAKQRGMGSGFFSMQINLVNLLFWGLLFGRLDDVYFTGPFYGLASLPGEVLVFFAGGVLLLSICFYTFYGMHEVEPPDRLSLDGERRPGEGVIRLFLRTFFKDIFGRDLLPLYLLLVVGTMTTVGLGILGPLLFTEQWGYTKQEMGTNVAVGAVLGMGTAILAGWVADKTSKMTVYLWALILGVAVKIAWTAYVFYLPDQRPSLVEIVLSGNIQFFFGQLAGVVSFPLILEYVERNRLGTAGAGMGIFNSTIRQGFTMFVGFYVLVWSVFFLPQAGDKVEIVLQQEMQESQIQNYLAAAGLDPVAFDIEALHSPGVDGPVSRHWRLRRPVADAGDLHKRLKELTTSISSLNNKLDNPLLNEAKRIALQHEVMTLETERADVEARLDASAAQFRTLLTDIFQATLVTEGGQIRSIDLSEDSTQITFELEVVEPVSEEAAEQLPALLDSVDLVRIETEPFTYDPGIHVSALADPLNGLRIELRRDPAFVALEKALLDAGRSMETAFDSVSEIMLALRATFGQDAAAISIQRVAVSGVLPATQLDFVLHANGHSSGLQISAANLQDVLQPLDAISSAVVLGNWPDFEVKLELGELESDLFEADALTARLRELLPEADTATIRALQTLYDRVEATAAARPVFLTLPRPVTTTEAADRVYDYFFSMQYFMILTDIFGLGVIALIFALERRGMIERRGANEDDNR